VIITTYLPSLKSFVVRSALTVDDCLATGVCADFRQRVDLDPVKASLIGEDEHIGVGRGHEEVFDDVLFLGLHADAAFAATPLRAVHRQR
jgi:hypothetical protein